MNQYFRNELAIAKKFIEQNAHDHALLHLERAHIIGQKSVIMHTLAHWYMLKVAFLKKDLREIYGQLIRLPLGILGSAIGIVPTGNNGRSNVPLFRKMTIPDDLVEFID